MQLLTPKKRILIHTGFWSVFLLLSFLVFSNFWPLHLAFLRTVSHGVLFILLFYINVIILIPKLFGSGRYFYYALSSVLLIVIFIPIRLVMQDYWFGEPGIMAVQSRPYFKEFMIVTSLLFVYLLSIFYKLAESQLISLEMNREVIRQRDEAELRMLKSQVNPHFLFNTLNNLYSLAYSRSEKTAGAIMALSEIMRYLIYETGATLVSAEKEVKFLTNYLRLEQLRIEDSGKVNFSVEQPVPGQMIPPLIFIAYVENAFKHSGIDIDPEGFIQVFLTFRKGEILFTCENSIFPERYSGTAGGMGLANAKSRLELMYPGRYSLEIRKSALLFLVTLRIIL